MLLYSSQFGCGWKESFAVASFPDRESLCLVPFKAGWNVPRPSNMSSVNRRHFMVGASVGALQCTRVMGANDRIGVAVIGCGMRGLLSEVLQFSNESNVEVTGVCDIWKAQRETAAERVKTTGAADPKLFTFEETLASPAVDAVLISTPDHQHCTQLSAAIKAKKDVYVEKPLAMNMKELLSAVDAVKRSDRIVQCGTQVRSWAPSVAGRAFVSSGGLGNIFKIEQSRNSFRPYWDGGAARKLVETDTNWKAFLWNQKYRPWDEDQYAGWMAYREFSRGPHTQFMAHFVDLVTFCHWGEISGPGDGDGRHVPLERRPANGARFDRGGAGIQGGISGAL
jgi:hypothetical protein